MKRVTSILMLCVLSIILNYTSVHARPNFQTIQQQHSMNIGNVHEIDYQTVNFDDCGDSGIVWSATSDITNGSTCECSIGTVSYEILDIRSAMVVYRENLLVSNYGYFWVQPADNQQYHYSTQFIGPYGKGFGPDGAFSKVTICIASVYCGTNSITV
ncbi:MAG: hypothetical protein C4294_19540 [Nitrospiraceae bacterium]